MDEQIIKQAKEKLLAEKKRLEAELVSFADKKEKVENDFTSRFPNYGDDVDSNAAEVDQFAANVALEQDLEKLLQDVSDALAKIEEGKYGVCERCGQEIEKERLLAYPAARECQRCKDIK